MQKRAAIQIFNGPGAGNIGDELMMHGMWAHIPPDFRLHVFLHENSRLQRQPYPARFTYQTLTLPPSTWELDGIADAAGLLAGTTLITDREGWGWPLDFLAPRLQHFWDRELPIDAVGIGADTLITPEGRQLFTNHFRRVRSWSVRNEASRDALLDAGVEPHRILVGADWAWLYQPPLDYTAWAADYLQACGIQPGAPLLIANLFWQGEGESLPIWKHIAAAFDHLHEQEGLQIAFFCNEVRHPGFDRTASETIRAAMRAPSVLLPNLYFGPGEAIALLRHATVTVGQRYHFCVETVLAGSVPVMLGRSPKIAGLCEELQLKPVGSLTSLDPDELIAAVKDAVREREARRAGLVEIRENMAARAGRNLAFFKLWHGYPDNGPAAR